LRAIDFGLPTCSTSAQYLRLDEHTLLSDLELQVADPHLDSVVNVNEHADYALALVRPAPMITLQCLGAGCPSTVRPRAVRAATPGAAAEAAGMTWDLQVLATVNGDRAGGDDLPLVAGDTIAFLAAT
jgi:molybdenum cofactor guanylyltransferase